MVGRERYSTMFLETEQRRGIGNFLRDFPVLLWPCRVFICGKCRRFVYSSRMRGSGAFMSYNWARWETTLFKCFLLTQPWVITTAVKWHNHMDSWIRDLNPTSMAIKAPPAKQYLCVELCDVFKFCLCKGGKWLPNAWLLLYLNCNCETFLWLRCCSVDYVPWREYSK